MNSKNIFDLISLKNKISVVTGGAGHLGSAISEVCMDFGVMPKKFLRIGLDNMYSSIVGSQQYLRSRYEMDSEAIVNKVKKMFNS